MSQPQPFYVPPVRHSPEKPEINRSTIYETNSDVRYKNPIDLLEKVYVASGKFSGVLRKSPGRHCKSERRSRKPFFSVCVEIQERQNKIIIRGYPKSHDENWPVPYPFSSALPLFRSSSLPLFLFFLITSKLGCPLGKSFCIMTTVFGHREGGLRSFYGS